MSRPKKIWIWKNKSKRFYNMWTARCEFCDPVKVWQYWAFGATLGSVQEHIRRYHRPVHMTQAEKTAFSKAWNKRYEKGKINASQDQKSTV